MTDTTVVDPTSAILVDRQKTHGSFEDNARVGQHLRWYFRAQDGWDDLTEMQREALDMIACKMSRILSGQGNHQDHWDDVAGYARLVSDRCASDRNRFDEELLTETFCPKERLAPEPDHTRPVPSAPIRVGWERPRFAEEDGA